MVLVRVEDVEVAASELRSDMKKESVAVNALPGFTEASHKDDQEHVRCRKRPRLGER